MSLKVWLPLNGDLENKGCSSYSITSIENSPTFTTGKIGQCYQRANSSSQLTNGLRLEDNLVNLLGTTASVSVWVKPLGTHTHYNGTIISSGDWNHSRWAFGVSQDNSQVDVLSGGHNKYITCSVPVNEWTHLVSTFDNGLCKLYKNGEYIGQRTGETAFSSDATWTGIGRESYAGGYFGFNGCINDLRIYNHVLSVAEIKEISQGLMLHYKLDNENNTEDLLADAQDLTTWNKESGITCTWDSTVGMYKVLDSTHTSSRWGIYKNLTLKANTTYFFYITGMKVDQSAGAGCAEGTSWPSNFKTFGTTAEIGSRIFTMGEADANCRIYLNLSPVEGGSNYAYYLSPHLITFTSNIIQDSSGYNNNATSNGSIAIKDDVETARYQHSTLFASGARIAMQVGSSTCLPTDAITVNIWVKSSNLANRFLSCTEGGGWNFEIYDSSYIRVPIYIAGKGYTYCNTSTTWSSISNNQWHMLSFTYDKQVEKVYVDGEMIGSSNSSYAGFNIGYNANTPLTLGAEAQTIASPIAGTYVGNLSDLRIYATPLLDSDIKSLYNIGMKIDNQNNAHPFEINELNTNKLTKSGILFDQIVEPYLTLSDGSKWKLMLCHYVDNGRRLFTSSNATYCNELGLYSRLNEITNYSYDNKYEYYVIQDGKEFRWTQTSSPTATSISGLTTVSGYLNPVNGLAKPTSLTQTYIGYGSWWGACGCWTSYSTGGKTGIPGFGSHDANGICENYLALYARISDTQFKLKDELVEAAEFIER